MGLFTRLGRMIRSNINSMLDSAENPEKVLAQAIRDMQEQYGQAKNQVAMQMVEQKKIEKKALKMREEAVGWKSKAQLAVSKGDDSLAKQALIRFKSSEDLASQFEQERERQAQNVESLKNALTALEKRIEDAKRRKGELLTRKQIAETKMNLSTTVSDVKESDAFGEFDRIASKIEDMELKSGVMLELSGEPQLEPEIKLLEESSEVDNELAKLKAEMAGDKGD